LASIREFSGARSDVDFHLAACELVFTSEPELFSTGVSRIRFSLRHCTAGSAVKFHNDCALKLAAGTWNLKSWDEYKALFVATFDDPNRAAEGRRGFASATQGEDELARDFFQRMDAFIMAAGFKGDEELMCQLVLMKLLPHIAKKIPKECATYDTLKEKAIEVDNRLREDKRAEAHHEHLRRAQAGLYGNASLPPPIVKPSSSIPIRRVPPASVSTAPLSTNTTPAVGSTLTPIVSTAATSAQSTPKPGYGARAGFCHNCGKKGHHKFECTKPALPKNVAKIVEEMEDEGTCIKLISALREDVDFSSDKA
jgi:hypothetical protein